MRLGSLAIASLFVASLASLSLVACKGKDATKGTTASPGSVATITGAAPAVSTAATAAATVAAPAAPSPAKLGLKPGEEIAASCDTIAKDGECGDVLVTDPAKKPELAKIMSMLCKKGTIGTACPTSAIVGSCRVGKDMLGHYYSGGGKAYDATTAKAACEKGHGHWVD
jgi:hypothetical protein